MVDVGCGTVGTEQGTSTTMNLFFGVGLWMLQTAVAEPYVSLTSEIEDTALSRVFELESDAERWTYVQRFTETVFDSARVYYEVGLQYNQRGDTAQALRYYRSALQVDGTYVPALYDCAEILLLQGDTEEAKQLLLRIQEIDAGYWVVSYRLAQISADEQAISDFERHLKQALQSGMPLQVLIDDRAQWLPKLQQPSVALSMELLLLALGENDAWKTLNEPLQKQ